MQHLYCHCRPGFEKECAAEIIERAAEHSVFGYTKTAPATALVEFVAANPGGAQQLLERLPFSSLIFTRQWFAGGPILTDLPPADRLTPLLAACDNYPQAVDVWAETTDTNDGKALSTLARKFSRPFIQALKKRQQLHTGGQWRLHLLFLSGTQVALGVSPVSNSAPWLMGIARLRQPQAAPSRATLKLEEAWHHFIPAQQWHERLAPGMRGVDLGAAPGGWTWQLVNRGMFVEAVDNGPMAQSLMDTGQVTHRVEDGFVFTPRRRVDWLVCDIADKPSRVAKLMAHWAVNHYFREAVFNLKLPMKQRYPEVKKLQERIEQQLDAAGIAGQLQFKQLYHDREEVTGHLRLF